MSNFFTWHYALENMLGEFDDRTVLQSDHGGDIYFNTTLNGVEVWLTPLYTIEQQAYVMFAVWVKDGSDRKIEFSLLYNSWDDLRHWVAGVDMPANNP